MKCIEWYMDSNTVGEKGTGDFECRNCGRIANNERENVYKVQGYTSSLFDDVPEDKSFTEFMDEHDKLEE